VETIEQAKVFLENRLQETKTTLDDHHPDTLMVKGRLVDMYQVNRDTEEGLKLGEQTVRQMKDIPGEDDLQTLRR